MVIGVFAGVLYGSSMVTRDLDICAVLTSENVERLRKSLADLNPQHRMTPQPLSFLQVPPPGQPVRNLYLRTDWGLVDIITEVTGLGDFETLKANAERFEIGGKSFRLISLPDLIRAKIAMGREKDLLAAKELEGIAAAKAPTKSDPELELD